MDTIVIARDTYGLWCYKNPRGNWVGFSRSSFEMEQGAREHHPGVQIIVDTEGVHEDAPRRAEA